MSPSSRWFDNSTSMTIGSCKEATKLPLPNGRYTKSDPINAGGHSWRIAFYPNGRLAGTTASMSLFLLRDDDGNPAKGGRTAADDDQDVVHVKFRFVMHQVYDYRSPVFMSSTVTAAFSRKNNAHGFERFVTRDDFEKTVLFKRDCFGIQCRLTVFPTGSKRAALPTSRSGRPDPPVVQAPQPPPPSAPPLPQPTPSVVRARVPPPAASPKPSVVTAAPPPASPAPSVAMSSAPPPPSAQQEPLVAGVSGRPASVPARQSARPPPPLSGLPADLGQLLATKKAADVELEVRGKVFAAHKAVLAARSLVFMEELFGPAKEEDTSYVRIAPDMRPEAFEAMLHYLYTDTLPPEMATMNSPEQGAVVLAEDLLAAADRYELKDLKLLTENKLCNHVVGVDTVLPMLALAERYQCCKLKRMCLEFTGSCGNTSAVMATNGLEILARSSPSVIREVITEILEARERRLINFCVFAFCFILPFLLFAIFS